MKQLKALEMKYERYQFKNVEKRQGSTKRKSECNLDTQPMHCDMRKFTYDNQKQPIPATKSTITSITNVETNGISALHQRSLFMESRQLHRNMYNIKLNRQGMVSGCSKIANRKASILVDIGYHRSLISMEVLYKLGHRMKKRWRRPAPPMTTMVVDNVQLPVMCSISLPITINDMTRFHTFLAVQHLPHECIIGADFINKHSLAINTRSDKVYFKQKNICPTTTPSQKQTSLYHNAAPQIIEHSHQLSTHSSAIERTSPISFTSANVSLPTITIFNHNRTQIETTNSKSGSNICSSTASPHETTILQQNPISSVNNNNRQSNISQLCSKPLYAYTTDAHKEPTQSIISCIDRMIERLNNVESIYKASIDENKRT
jgi:hypothetical protein